MNTSDPKCVIAELRDEGQVLHLTLSAPKANILDSRMIAGINDALDKYGDATTLKAIAFEGEGKHFCFGASVEEHQADQAADMLASFHGLFRRLSAMSVPTVAIVRGQCLGEDLSLRPTVRGFSPVRRLTLGSLK